MKLSIIILSLLFSQGISFSQTATSKPFVLGVTEEIQSVQLAEKRTLNIYLPDGYNKNDTVKYPVIYLLDGSADEDFIHVAGLVQFNSFPWIKRIPESIIVGIANVNRQRDFTYPTTLAEDKKNFPATGHSDKFIAFIQKELQPFVDKNYRTNSSKTIIGESLGGLLATEILFRHPNLFNKYIIISPSLWWDDASLLKLSPAILDSNFTKRISVYIGTGKEGIAPTAIPHSMIADANLLADKIEHTKSKTVTVYLDYIPVEDHATIGHQAIYNAIRILKE